MADIVCFLIWLQMLESHVSLFSCFLGLGLALHFVQVLAYLKQDAASGSLSISGCMM